MGKQRARKPHKSITRRELMRQLHDEIVRSGRPVTSRYLAPLVFELADKAKVARGRTVHFRGVKFKLKIGLWLNVCDETGEIIFSTSGGVL